MLLQSFYHRDLHWNVYVAATVLWVILAVALPEDWLSGSLHMCPCSIPMLFILDC